MHYTREYKQPTRQEREAAALKDAEDFVGVLNLPKILDGMAKELEYCCSFGQLKERVRFQRQMLAILLGVEGVPATAMIRYAVKNRNRAA